MSTFLRYLLLGSVVFIGLMILLRPRQVRTLGQKVRLVGLIYVAVILTSGALRLACLNGWFGGATCGWFGLGT